MTRLIAGLIGAGALALIVTLVLLARSDDTDGISPRVRGDVDETVAAMGDAEMPALAESFLATDRPWRAARTMAAYLEDRDDPSPEDLLLAARAEAGWGAWNRVRELLEDVPALDTHENGLGLYLLARSLDETGQPAEAIDAYRSFLALSAPAGEVEDQRRVARLRMGLALIRAGQDDGEEEVRAAAEAVGATDGDAARWFRILRADAYAAAGDTAAVRRAVEGLDSGIPGLRAWRARVEAARQVGDVASARALANEARSWASTSGTRSEFLLSAGRSALAMGDTAPARDAFRAVIDRSAAGAPARQAAELLLQGSMTPDDHLAVARVHSAQGLHQESVEGFRRWLEAGRGSAAERSDVRLELATALFYAEEYRQALNVLEPIMGRRAARLLAARTEAHRGRADEAAAIYLAVADERAGTGAGASALFLAAGVRHDEGDVDEARRLYERVVSQYPGHDLMGLSLMRLAGMAFEEGDYQEAADLWDRYRRRYSRGDRILQATYWAARAREEAGNGAGAAPLYREIREAEPDSYYALLAARRLDEPFWPIPMTENPAPDADADARVLEWMAAVDLLRDAGFPGTASARADELAANVGGDRATRYALAEALAERGYAQRAIRIGISLGTSAPPSRRLLRILYPFPYRTLITAEARDRGLDPFVVAALIRQESMFEERITSHVGARGLMQIMPATGRGLADAVGLEPWDAEVLYHPEVNVHLGTRYLAQHMKTYDGSLPSVFSAYNAGAHRVEWWSAFPEYGDDELFTERIPYRETRNYVRILTRNHALYSGLYGDEPASADQGPTDQAPAN